MQQGKVGGMGAHFTLLPSKLRSQPPKICRKPAGAPFRAWPDPPPVLSLRTKK